MADPITTPTEQELQAADLTTRRGGKITPVRPDHLRQLPHDVVLAIAEQFPPTKIAKLLGELAEAECITNGGRRIPDNRTRQAALTLMLAYLIGRPVERSESVSVNLTAEDAVGLRERLAHSPALRDALRGALIEAESIAPPG